jgi:D-tyrosyl-tRNA(Tyr) deacylase
VVQRVASARVRVGERVVGEIGPGLLVFAGIEQGDTSRDLSYIAGKVRDLRIFDDADGRMNEAASERGAEILLVSQFTLCGDCRRGRRPSFDAAAPPAVARPIYDALIEELRQTGQRVETGEFQAHMSVELVNDGPVTILLDSRKRW